MLFVTRERTRRGMPRQNARAKDSEWVRQRKAWEAGKPADVNEVLLSTPGSGAGLLEGLTSNFLALDGQGALVTADEGVLSGTVRELVLEVGVGEGCGVLQADTSCDTHAHTHTP